MQNQIITNQLTIHECIDGLCPVGIESVKEIGLTPREKRAIFISLREEIYKLKTESERGI